MSDEEIFNYYIKYVKTILDNNDGKPSKDGMSFAQYKDYITAERQKGNI